MPSGFAPPSASDCYRFVLSNPQVDISMMGAKTAIQMQENLETLKLGPLDENEMLQMKEIGDYIYHK
jgi:aryl-alcohol dehydrogenase-like predicted oxidoreductase